MNLSVRATGPWQHTLDIEVPADEVERRLDEVARADPAARQPARVPQGQGAARPGAPALRGRGRAGVPRGVHAPRHRRGGRPGAARPGGPAAGAQPALHARASRCSFEALVDVRPEVEAKDYQGLPVARARCARSTTRRSSACSSDLREESAVFVDLDRPAERGDVVLLDSIRLDANGRRLPSTRAKGLRIAARRPGAAAGPRERPARAPRRARSAPSTSTTRPTTACPSWLGTPCVTWSRCAKSRRRSCAIWTITSLERCSSSTRSRSCASRVRLESGGRGAGPDAARDRAARSPRSWSAATRSSCPSAWWSGCWTG